MERTTWDSNISSLRNFFRQNLQTGFPSIQSVPGVLSVDVRSPGVRLPNHVHLMTCLSGAVHPWHLQRHYLCFMYLYDAVQVNAAYGLLMKGLLCYTRHLLTSLRRRIDSSQGFLPNFNTKKNRKHKFMLLKGYERMIPGLDRRKQYTSIR